MRRAPAWLLGLALGFGLHAPQALAQEPSGPAASAPALPAETPALVQWMRLVELDGGPAVRQRLLAGQDPNAMDHRGQRALHWALMHESGKVVTVLLDDPRTDPNALNHAGEKPLWLAAMRGRLDWVQALVRRGATLEQGRADPAARAWTTLHYAVLAPRPEVLRWLLAQGGLDLNAGSINGSTPLMMAFGYGSLEAAELLLQAGADPQRRNDLGLDAWEFARRAGRDDIARRLGLRPAPAAGSVSEKR